MKRSPYVCRSWRCVGGCDRGEAATLFSRASEAFEGSAAPQVYLVLTIDRRGYFSGERWRSAEDAYRALGRMTRILLKRLRRRYSDIGSRWIATVEAHRSGWPHLNLVVESRELAEELLAAGPHRELVGGGRVRESWPLRGELREQARESGWGEVGSAEVARDARALAGYLAGIALHTGAGYGELAKLTQAPLSAPKRLRRYRSGRRFLPPRYRSPPVAGGALVRAVYRAGQLAACGCRHDERGAEIVAAEVARHRAAPAERALDAARGALAKDWRAAGGGATLSPGNGAHEGMRHEKL